MSPDQSGVPQPFTDIVGDRRSDDQRAADMAAAQKQVGYFSGGLEEQTPYSELIAGLQKRRAGDPGAVQFDLASPTTSGAQPLVVRNEVLLRRNVGNTDEPQADTLLNSLSFFRQDQVAPGWDCPELDSRLVRYVAPPDQHSDFARVVDTVQKLTAAGFSVGHVGVAAFQDHPHPPGGDVVVKLAEGPAPTSVSDATAPAGEGTSPVVVAVLDTGIAKLLHGDGWLDTVPRVQGSLDPLDAFPVNSPPTLPGNGYLDFAAGHGTFVAGVVQSVEPQATIRAYAVLDSDGYGSEVDVAAAMIAAVKDGATVINLSLGVRTVDGLPPLALQAAFDVIADLTAGGEPPVLVAAAGNFGDDIPVYPAAMRGVVAVAALDADERPAGWSSRGGWVRFSTIGAGVVAPYVVGIREPDYGGAVFPLPGWAMWTGTSFAAPQIAAAVARTCREQGVGPQEAVGRLAALATPNPAFPSSEFGVPLRLLPGT